MMVYKQFAASVASRRHQQTFCGFSFWRPAPCWSWWAWSVLWVTWLVTWLTPRRTHSSASGLSIFPFLAIFRIVVVVTLLIFLLFVVVVVIAAFLLYPEFCNLIYSQQRMSFRVAIIDDAYLQKSLLDDGETVLLMIFFAGSNYSLRRV